MRTTRQFIISSDFEELRTDRVEGTSTVTIANGVITLKSLNTTNRGWAYLPLGVLKSNARIEVICEAKLISGAGRLSIDCNATVVHDGGNKQDIFIDSTEWKPYALEYTVSPNDNKYASVIFGCWQSDIGEVSFRNIVIRLYEGELIVPEFIMCQIKYIPGTGWIIDDAPGRFVNHRAISVTPTTDSGGNYLLLTYEGLSIWSRPMVFCQVEYWQAGIGVIAQAAFSQVGSVRIYLYSTITNALVNPLSMPSNECNIAVKVEGI